MLSPQSWLPQAEGLAMGHRARVDHDCGGGRTLLISRSPDGLRAHCFRCNDSGSARGPQESLADKLARIAKHGEADAVYAGSVSGPEPTVHDVDGWPPAARLWFYRAGLSRADIGRIGAYYHPPTNRVVLPVWQGGELIYWQARSIDGRQPKYLGAAVRPANMIASFGSAVEPTLCEDMLSAYKVGLVAEGWAVLGTSIPSGMLSELMRRAVRVNVWLDPDKAGQRAALKYIKQLRAYEIDVRNIVSTRDPKLHTRAEIMEYLA